MFNSYEIKELSSTQTIKDFILKYHYIKTLPRGCGKVFVLYINGLLSGAACYGEPVGQRAKTVYGKDIVELKRFVLIPDMPKNSCSWFIAKCYKALKKAGHKRILSYADPTQGHEGVIYKASNFSYLGKQKYRTPFIEHGGKVIYGRNLYNKKTTKYNHIKKLITKKKLKIQWKEPKHIYLYEERK